MLGILLFALAANPKLVEARAQADDFDFQGALKSLEQAIAQEGNDRETTLSIVELQGVVWGNLNKPAKARTAFITLLTLDPDRVLSGDYPPRVRTPFYEAKEAVTRSGPLKLAREAPTKEGEQLTAVSV